MRQKYTLGGYPLDYFFKVYVRLTHSLVNSADCHLNFLIIYCFICFFFTGTRRVPAPSGSSV